MLDIKLFVLHHIFHENKCFSAKVANVLAQNLQAKLLSRRPICNCMCNHKPKNVGQHSKNMKGIYQYNFLSSGKID